MPPNPPYLICFSANRFSSASSYCGAISSSPLLVTPKARQGKAVKPVNNVAPRCVQVRDREVTMIEMDNLISREHPFQVTGHLMRAKMGSIGKNREQVPRSGIRRFRFAA